MEMMIRMVMNWQELHSEIRAFYVLLTEQYACTHLIKTKPDFDFTYEAETLNKSHKEWMQNFFNHRQLTLQSKWHSSIKICLWSMQYEIGMQHV
jgi:hypothetical protein